MCSCPAGYEGDPYTGCIADPCSQSPCGINAECSKNGRNKPRPEWGRIWNKGRVRSRCGSRNGVEVRLGKGWGLEVGVWLGVWVGLGVGEGLEVRVGVEVGVG